jgi:hypothetical protein
VSTLALETGFKDDPAIWRPSESSSKLARLAADYQLFNQFARNQNGAMVFHE